MDLPRIGTTDVANFAGLAVLIVDGRRRLQVANSLAEALLAKGGPLCLCNGVLRARNHSADGRLHGLIAGAASGGGTHGGAMRLPVDETTALRVVVTPWRAAGRTRVLLVIDDPDARDPSLPAKLAGLYGLTMAEAETVTALADGVSPAEAAEARGVGLATVRSQIHHALRKVDARSISDLVRLAVSIPRVRPPQRP